MSDTTDLDEQQRRIDEQRQRLQNGDVIDETGEKQQAASSPARTKDVWPHETINAFDEEWQVRVPAQNALTAISLSSGKYVPQQVQNDVVGLFLRNHMSEASFTRLFERLADPTDDTFDTQALGVIMNELAQLTLNKQG